jgi:hypothetical protein
MPIELPSPTGLFFNALAEMNLSMGLATLQIALMLSCYPQLVRFVVDVSLHERFGTDSYLGINYLRAVPFSCVFDKSY